MTDDYEGFERDNYVAERGAYERTVRSSPLDECIGTSPTEQKERAQWMRTLEPRQRFCLALKSEILPQIEPVYGKVNEQSIVDFMDKVVGLDYLNPCAFILGLIASDSGRSLKPKTVQSVIDRLPESLAVNFGITPPDIVRYGRLWKKYL